MAQFFLGPGYHRGYESTYEDRTPVLVLVTNRNRVGWSKNWSRASGEFDLTDSKADAVGVVATTWLASTDSSTLYAALNTDLTAAGYTRPDGSVIT